MRNLWEWLLRVFVRRSLPTRSAVITVPLSTGYEKWTVSATGSNPVGIVLHHSWSEDSDDRDWGAIRKYHTSYRYKGEIISQERYEELKNSGKTIGLERPWNDIGYHLGIEKIKGRYQVQEGRPIRSIGAHTLGVDAQGRSFNAFYIGICLVGNFDRQVPSGSALFLLRSMCRDLQRLFGFTADHILGHRETFTVRELPVAKSCPGNQFDLERFRNSLKGGYHA